MNCTQTHVVLLALGQALVFLLLSRGQQPVLFVSRQIGTNLHLNGFLERVLLVDSHCWWSPQLRTMARLPRTSHFQKQLDLAVFKLKGIVVLVHQLQNLKGILFKKRYIFHLQYTEFCKAVLIFKKPLLKTNLSPKSTIV